MKLSLSFLLFLLLLLASQGYSQTAIEYFKRAESEKKQNDFKGAISDYTKAIAMNPSWVANLYFNRGLAEIELGQKDIGCLDLYKAGELGNETAFIAVIKYCK